MEINRVVGEKWRPISTRSSAGSDGLCTFSSSGAQEVCEPGLGRARATGRRGGGGRLSQRRVGGHADVALAAGDLHLAVTGETRGRVGVGDLQAGGG